MSEMTTESAEVRVDGRTREARAARFAERAPYTEKLPQTALGDLPGVAEIAAQAMQDASVGKDHGPTPDEHSVTRATRRPFGAMAQKLAYPPRAGFHRHWFNDNPGRVEFAVEEAGYKHVVDPRTGKNVQRVVGTREGGAPITAFLLEIPQDWFDDDMMRYEQENSARDESIRRGQVQAKSAADQSKFYPSAQGRDIKFQTNRR